MSRPEFDKVVANQALEATKAVLTALQKWVYALELRGEPKPKNLTKLYADTRRLRDYLRRVIGGPSPKAVLDLSDEDANHLAACCLFLHEGTVKEAQQSRDLRPADKSWLEEQRKYLAHLVEAFASREVMVIPSEHGVQPLTVAGRDLLGRLREKFAAKIGGVEAESLETKPNVQKASFGIARGFYTGLSPSKPNPMPDDAEAQEGEQEKGDEQEDGDAPAPPEFGTGMDRSIAFGQGDNTAELTLEDPGDVATLGLDLGMLRDPRLRTMLALDVRAMRRAQESRDYRLAAVHLGSIFEGLMVDVALSRKSELQLRGTPETWKLDEVVKQILGERYNSADRGTLYHLVACRNLIRPAVQLLNPIVVTRMTFEKMMSFVEQVLFQCGLRGSEVDSPTDREATPSE